MLRIVVPPCAPVEADLKPVLPRLAMGEVFAAGCRYAREAMHQTFAE